MHIRDLKMKNSRECNNNKPRKEIIVNIPKQTNLLEITRKRSWE